MTKSPHSCPDTVEASYRDAIDEALVVRHLGVAEGNARAELNQILSWEVAVALDPRVSEAAQDLIEQGTRPVAQPPANPIAWVIPGDDNAKDSGFIDAMAWQEGEFTRPLYAAPPAPAQAWRCISTAPRDGTPFLCFHPDNEFSEQTGIDLIWYEPSIRTYTMDGDNEVPFAGITHWMPLPKPPSAVSSTEGKTR